MKVVNNNNGTFTITKEIKLSEKHIDTLKTIVENGGYYHYSQVCVLLSRILKSKEWVDHYEDQR